MIKGIAMAQWVNRLRNSIFVNPPPLPLSCEISGALHVEGLVIATQIRKDSTRKSAAIILATNDMRSHTITARKNGKNLTYA